MGWSWACCGSGGGSGSGVPEAPLTGAAYVRASETWVPVFAVYQANDGGSFTTGDGAPIYAQPFPDGGDFEGS